MYWVLFIYEQEQKMSTITLLDGGMGQELLRRSSRAVTPMWSADIC
jgi:S-methylmethionine-dependent homocysteine/selenocysteine methylase